MKVTAAVLNESGGQLSIEQLELEEPRDLEIRVRLIATGVCHTDISVMGRPFPVNQPIVLGHEGAGIVDAIGKSVSKVQVGDRVVLSYNFCGACQSCQAKASSYCQYFFGTNFQGQRMDGSSALSKNGMPIRHNFFGQSSFATHCLCTERNVIKVPESVPNDLFELLGPLGCGIQTGAGAMMNVLKPEAGNSVAVFGSGAVGMSAIMAAKVMGANTIIAIDKDANRLEIAKELGATHAILSDSVSDTVAQVRCITGAGATCSLDTTAVGAVLRQALDCLAPLGRCGFVGGSPVGTTLTVDVRDVMLNGKTLRGIVEGDSNADVFIPTLLGLQERGVFPFEKMMKIYPFTSITQAIADAKSGATVKPVLRM